MYTVGWGGVGWRLLNIYEVYIIAALGRGVLDLTTVTGELHDREVSTQRVVGEKFRC